MLCTDCQQWWQVASTIQPPGKIRGRDFERRLHSSFSTLQDSAANACNFCAIVLSSIERSRKDLLNTWRPWDALSPTDVEPQPTDEVYLGLFLNRIDPRDQLDQSEVHASVYSCLKNENHQSLFSDTFLSNLPHQGPYEWHDVGGLVLGMPEILQETLRETSDVPDDFTGSDSTFRFIFAWIQQVLDVGPSDDSHEPRLIETSGVHGRYLALSHCWGDPKTSGIVRTTKDTYSDRLAGIPLQILPKTFQDAIQITRKLDIRWLWIDSLCIIQDSPEDWETQAAEMCNIYRNSYLTIATSSANNSSIGCFSSRNGHLTRPLELPFTIPRTHSNGPSGPSFLSLEGCEETTNASLDSRCWTLQERVLSPCIISYEDNTVAFCCNSIKCNEYDPSGRFYQELSRDYKQLQWSFLYHTVSTINEDGPKDKAVSAKITTSKEQAHHISWTGLVENYTQRHLTYNKDKLAAIYGITDAVQQRKDDIYLAGLWRTWLLYDLLWAVNWKHRGSGRIIPSVAPSWSWASVNSPIQTYWSGNKLQDLRPQPLAKFLLVEVEGPMSAQTGKIIVEGYLKSAIASNDPKYSSMKSKGDDDFDIEEGEYRLYDENPNTPLDAAILPDEPIASPTMQITFIALAQMHQAEIPSIVCLGLVRDGDEGQFKRVGLGQWAQYAWLGRKRPSDLAIGLKYEVSRRMRKVGKERRESRIASAGWENDVPGMGDKTSKASGLERRIITIV